jgi:hypothetical protein
MKVVSKITIPEVSISIVFLKITFNLTEKIVEIIINL